MVDFVLFSSGNNSDSDISIVSLLNIQSCVKAAEQYYFWLLILLIFPALINCFSLAISLITIIHVRQLKSVTEAVTSSTHWLARTASRIGLGISAHNAMIEYAKKKNLMKLMPNTEHRIGNLNFRKLRNSGEPQWISA